MIHIGWTFVLNTINPQKANKLKARVNKCLGESVISKNCETVENSFRYYCESAHEDFSAVREVLDSISPEWQCVTFNCLQGIATHSIRITGVSWVNFWFREAAFGRAGKDA